MAKKNKAEANPTPVVKAYLRVSTDKQTVENQRFELDRFAKSKGLVVDEWCEDTASGTISYKERKLGALVDGLKGGDTLIVSELSRLGRSLLEIMSLLHLFMERNVVVFAVKEGYELGNNISSKVLAFAFGLSAEIERTLISQRTKEGLARRRAEGVILGRRKGCLSNISTRPVHKHVHEVKHLLANLQSKSEIARRLGLHRTTLFNYLRDYKITHLSIMEEREEAVQKLLHRDIYICHYDMAKILKVSPHVLKIYLAERQRKQN